MPRFVLSGVLLATLLAALVWFDSPSFRNGLVPTRGTQACAVSQMVNLPRDADLLVIGTSRLRQAVDPALVESASEGQIHNAYNLARSYNNLARKYTLLRDALASGVRPRYVVVEVDLTSLGRRPARDPIPIGSDTGILRYSDIMDSFRIHGDRPLVERTHAVAQKLLLKLKLSLEFALTGNSLRYRWLAVSNAEAEKVCTPKRYQTQLPEHRESLVKTRAFMDRLFGPQRASMEDDRFTLVTSRMALEELYYLGKIRRLAVRYGITLRVTQPWLAYQPPLSRSAQSRIQAVVPEFIYPPADLVRSSWEHFFERNHMDVEARAAYSRWLAVAIPASRTPL